MADIISHLAHPNASLRCTASEALQALHGRIVLGQPGRTPTAQLTMERRANVDAAERAAEVHVLEEN